MKKYELIKSDKKGFFRVKALRAFADVEIGDIGGYVEKEHNLSHHGDCWIYDHGMACDDGRVCGNGIVADYGLVCDTGRVSGYGMVCDFGMVTDNSKVRSNDKISGSDCISDSDPIPEKTGSARYKKGDQLELELSEQKHRINVGWKKVVYFNDNYELISDIAGVICYESSQPYIYITTNSASDMNHIKGELSRIL